MNDPPKEVRESLQRIIDYMWADEQRDYETHEGLSDEQRDYTANHIFTHLQRVQAWLSDTQKEVTE